MGISLAMIEKMRGLGLFGNGRISVLDVGSSNLYSASAAGIEAFLRAYGAFEGPDAKAFADRLAAGSAYDPSSGGINGSFVGELFERAGIKYNAIDIADGYRTTILDLNHDAAPPEFACRFDLVLNFGTTEHLLNQYNAFKVMHDSTKVGGYIVNSLPCVGYSNHGYFTYTPRCMFDLAGYNEYEVVGFWFEGPGGNNDLFAPIRDYQSYFPSLSQTLGERESTEIGRKLADLELPDIGLLAVYRKVKARSFAGALERSTSVGAVPKSITAGYESSARSGAATLHGNQVSGLPEGTSLWTRIRNLFPGALPTARERHTTDADLAHLQQSPPPQAGSLDRHDDIPLEGRAHELRERFVSRGLSLEECLEFYTIVAEAHGRFPRDWEYQILLIALERYPDRADLQQRMAEVRGLLSRA